MLSHQPTKVFSKRLIDATLGEALTESKALFLETESEAGPGYLNPHLLIRGNEKNIFLQTLPSPTNPSKQTILLCDPLLRDRPLFTIEHIYYASLCHHYDVYFWLGPEVPLMSADCPILHSIADFDKQRAHIFPATKEKVISALGEQGFAADSILVLDHSALSTVMNKLKNNIEKAKEWNEHWDLTGGDRVF